MISPAPLLAPISLVVGAIILAFTSLWTREKRVYDGLAVMFTLVSLGLTLYTFMLVQQPGSVVVYGSGGWPPPLGIVYVVDKFSAVMGVTAAAIMFLVVLYSIGYLGDNGKPRALYYVVMLLLGAAVEAIFYTGDLFNFFVMIELMAVTAYGLVAYRKDKGVAVEASIKYGIAACLAGIVLFVGVGFIYAYMGTLSMPDLAAKLNNISTPMSYFSGVQASSITPVILILSLILWPLLLESAVFPLHFWLPDAHSEALSPVSAVLSGLVVNAGLYGVARLLYSVFGAVHSTMSSLGIVMTVLIIVGILGAFYSSIRMLVEKDVKRVIAFSTVLHMSYITIGIGLGTAAALTAVMYHFLAHAVSKTLAFLSIGILVAAAGSRRLDDLRGYARYYPGVVAATILAMLGLAGVPPLGTFPSKLLLIQASIGSGQIVAAGTIVVTSAIAAVAYFRIIDRLINKKPSRASYLGSSITTRTVLLLLCIGVVAIGLFMPVIYHYLEGASILASNPAWYSSTVEKILRLFGL